MPAGVLGNTAQESWCVLPWRPVPSTTKKSPDRSRIPVDIPTGWEPPWPYGLHLLIFPQPLGRALKNQNAAPTTPPCFCRRQRSSSLLFKSCTVHHKKIPRPNGLGMWWSIVHGTRTQHFLTGDRFGIIREVEIEYDPVIKDVDRVDKGINDLPLVFHVSHVTLAEFFKPEPHPFAGQDWLFQLFF